MKLRSLLNTKALGLVVAMGLALVIAPNAHAQRGQGGQGGGGQRGGGMRMMGGMGSSPAFLLRRADVQDDLKLTGEQKDRLNVMQEDMTKSMRERFMSGGERPSREEMTKIFETMQKEAEAKVAEILTPEQVKRLDQIAVQMAGNAAAMNPKFAKDLNITADQKTKMEALSTAMQSANRGVQQKMRSGDLDRDAGMETMKKNSDALNVEIGKLLTQTQKDKLKAMSGAPFTRKDEDGL